MSTLSMKKRRSEIPVGPGRPILFQDFAKFDSSRSKVQNIDELNHFDLYLVHWKSLMGFLQNPHLLVVRLFAQIFAVGMNYVFVPVEAFLFNTFQRTVAFIVTVHINITVAFFHFS
ncbi:hypothetical protein KAI37_04318 [Paenibacillus sp. S25]|nr:hypothetical protein KAI37_04318 [Paenibacillus sp. S25]